MGEIKYYLQSFHVCATSENVYVSMGLTLSSLKNERCLTSPRQYPLSFPCRVVKGELPGRCRPLATDRSQQEQRKTV